MNVEVLIIDEGMSYIPLHYQLQERKSTLTNLRRLVSMLDGDLFDKLAGVASEIRGIDEPFGGIQVRDTTQFGFTVTFRPSI